MKSSLTQSIERIRKANQRLRQLIAEAIEFNQKLQSKLFTVMKDECDGEAPLPQRRGQKARGTRGRGGRRDDAPAAVDLGRVNPTRPARTRSSKRSGSTKTVRRNSK